MAQDAAIRVSGLHKSYGEHEAIRGIDFEVGKGEVGKGGVVRDPAQHARVVEEVNAAARSLGLLSRGVTESPITGADGNREFLALYEKA